MVCGTLLLAQEAWFERHTFSLTLVVVAKHIPM